jgi:hypothetical protein
VVAQEALGQLGAVVVAQADTTAQVEQETLVLQHINLVLHQAAMDPQTWFLPTLTMWAMAAAVLVHWVKVSQEILPAKEDPVVQLVVGQC